MRSLVASLVVLLGVTAPCAVRADVPATITFAAHLEDQGVPMTGPHAFGFELILVDQLGNETSVWAESHGSIVVVDGFVSVELGTLDSLLGDVLVKSPLYLDVTVDNVPLSPRLEVTSAPFALRAGEAETLGGKTAGQFFQLGTLFLCPAGERMVGLDVAAGNVICGPDPGGGGGGQTYGAGSGLQLVGNVFSIAPGGVGGGHLAGNSVFSAKIVNESILGEDILDGTITGADLADGTIGSVDIEDGTITGSDLAEGSVSTSTIVDGTIAGEDLQGNIIEPVHLQAGAVTAAKLAPDAVGGLAKTTGLGLSVFVPVSANGPVLIRSTTASFPGPGLALITLQADVNFPYIAGENDRAVCRLLENGVQVDEWVWLDFGNGLIDPVVVSRAVVAGTRTYALECYSAVLAGLDYDVDRPEIIVQFARAL